MHPIEHLRFVARAQGADPAMLAALSALSLDHSGLVVACRRVVERHPTVGPLWWMCAHLLVSAEPRHRARELIDELHVDPTVDRLVDELPASSTVLTAGAGPLVSDALVRRGDVSVAIATDDGADGGELLARRLARSDVACSEIPFSATAAVAAEADLVLVEAGALDGARALAGPGNAVLTAVAAAAGVPVWLVAGRGRLLPSAYVDAMVAVTGSRFGGLSGSGAFDGEPDFGQSHGRSPVDVIDPSDVARVIAADGAAAPASFAFTAECPLATELTPV